MTVLTTARRALALADAYLRIDLTSNLTDVICGSQVDFLLVDIYRDDDVRPGPHGRYQVTTDSGTVRFAPLASSRVPYADWYQHATLPDGRTSYQHAPMTAAKVAKQLPGVRGVVYTLRDGSLVRVFQARCAETWTPLPQAPQEHP
ncbi:hypothetical protein ABZS76_32975 [Streptomyces sp. NPDC005562]|uniref:hypothetical protein n=1 Tax=Streptomyces sp. NPDC005562 TaxID=3154890 RepID=UPI0033B8C483